jgi:hypothetical protein
MDHVQNQEQRVKTGEMQVDRSVPRYIGIFGSITALLLITYFSIASALDFKEIEELRYLNVFILFGGVFIANYFYHRHDKHITNYLNGFALGMGTTAFAGGIFAIFMYIFMKFMAPEFGLNVKEAIPFSFVSIELIALITFIETVLSGFMATFAAMQYYKNVKAD